MKRIYNFSPGPAILPEEVLRQASQAVLEIDGSGMSILEISHRGREFAAIHSEAKSTLLRVLNLDANEYEVLFLGGGASMQFAMLPMNFLAEGRSADYVDTGEWSLKAMKEARRYGNVRVAASSVEAHYSEIPAFEPPAAGAAYYHITTNNTIEGTQWCDLPVTGVTPLAVDMSSDFMARDIDHTRCAFVYAGAQKNAGPAGVTVVIARRSFLSRAAPDLPAMLAYATHVKNDSLYNTPPVFGIYVVGLVARWIEAQGGLAVVEARNRRKSALIYAALDSHPDIFDVPVRRICDRSIMNIVFRVRDKDREPAFLQGARERDMSGLKGHRSVGGFRASIYNAFPHEGAEALAAYLTEFAEARA
jgi:phosphoserine aminotransferase